MAEWNRDTAWRQGHLLCKDAREALELRDGLAPDQTVVIVTSHDCDLTQDPRLEPMVEVVVGRRITGSDGNFTHSKNARKLHIKFAASSDFWGEFEATAKISIDKLALNNFTPCPDARLTAEDHAIFQMWLASRYRRSAFPDEFERRLSESKLHEKIAKAVKPHGELIVGVFFDVDDGAEITRAGPEDTYTLDIIVLHSADTDFNTAEDAGKDPAKIIEKAFKDKLFAPTKTWQHIELRSCELMSESVLAYQYFKQLKRWRLEHISLAAEPQQAVVAE